MPKLTSRVLVLAMAVLGVVSVATAQSPAPSPPAAAPAKVDPARPAFTIIRWGEDYSFLRDPGKREGFLDNLKYIPLGQDVHLSLGGQARLRYENYTHLNFGAGKQDTGGSYLTRALIHADLHLGSNVRVFAMGKTSLEDGRDQGPRSTDRDEYDIQQLFGDLKLPWADDASTTLRFGRFELLYGGQRVIGSSDWSNTRRAFEGFWSRNSFKNDWSSHNLDVFLTRPVLVDPTRFNDGDGDQTFWGVYDSISLPTLIAKAGTKLDLYLLGQHLSKTATRSFDAETYTVGARFTTKPKPWDADVEVAYQFGDRDSAEISAWMAAAEAGYTFDDVTLAPRLFAGFDYASGDGDGTADGKFNRWNPLYVTNHRYLGESDTIGRVNVISPNVGIDFTLAKNKSWAEKLSLRAAYWAFWRADTSDSVFVEINSNSALSRPQSSSDAFVGQEINLTLNWQYNRNLMFVANISHFFAGDYINSSSGGDSSVAKDITFAYFSAQFTF